MTLYSLNTGYFKLDGGAMFGVVPKTIWNNLNPADEKNLCSWALRCLLIEDGNRLILIDTGNGDKQDEKFFGHYYLSDTKSLAVCLKEKGFSCDDVTDVILSHLHFDHCGGAINRVNDKLIPAFKNATYWSNEAHWQWATKPNAREKASFLKENILPIKESGQLQFISVARSDGKKLAETKFTGNLSIRFTHGHTEAQMLPQIKYKNKIILYAADFFPSTAHIPLPYVMGYDMFPLTTMLEKKMFLDEAVLNDYILFFEHDPINECCTLQKTEKGIRAKECFDLEMVK